MRLRPRILLAAAAALGLGGCTGPCQPIDSLSRPGAASGRADFTVIAALGTSISAGFTSGGLVDRHQVHAFPMVLAEQTGHALALDGSLGFTFSAIDHDGFPPLLELKSLSPLVVDNDGRVAGNPTNLAQPRAFHNLAVPGFAVVDLADTSFYYSDPASPRYPFFNWIARRHGSVLDQALGNGPTALAPPATFFTVDVGSSEVLGPLTLGNDSVLVSPGAFHFVLQTSLAPIQTGLAIVNVPDVTSLPFATTFPPFTRTTGGAPVALIGEETPGNPQPLSAGDFVLLTAADSLAIGTGFPLGAVNYLNPSAPGNGRPLNQRQVLSASEAVNLRATIDQYNAAIASVAALHGAALVDLHALLAYASTTGLRFQGTTYNTRYLVGGLIGLDGIHPTDLGQGFISNALIAEVNATYGSRIPFADLGAAATATASHARRGGREDAAPPWVQGLGPASFPWARGSAVLP